MGYPIELLKATGDGMIKEITSLCNKTWERVEWPSDWGKSIIISIFKKGEVRECENYRTISLTSKILLKIIHKSMDNALEMELLANQAGFIRKRRGTRDHIANLKWIMERYREFRYIYALSTTARLCQSCTDVENTERNGNTKTFHCATQESL